MNTLFEIFGREPIENIITCLNFKLDKVVFWGYSKDIESYGQNLTNYLKKECGVSQVVLKDLPMNDLQGILSIMKETITDEVNSGNKVYFDITGGNDLLLVAFGMLAKEYDCPIHVYDVMENRLIELEEGASRTISKDLMKRHIAINLKDYIKLHGAVINFKRHKDNKSINDEEFSRDLDSLWDVNCKYASTWNVFSSFLRYKLKADDDLFVRSSVNDVHAALNEKQFVNSLNIRKLTSIIDSLAMAGLLLDVKHDNGIFQFRYKNESIKACIWESGSVLELHTFKKLSKEYDDCMVGVHLDWDGVINAKQSEDVYNEIDVLAIKNGIPTFISCKAGKLTDADTIHLAFYELQTVTERFGGKYANKHLAILNDISHNYELRAEEMNIKIVKENK